MNVTVQDVRSAIALTAFLAALVLAPGPDLGAQAPAAPQGGRGAAPGGRGAAVPAAPQTPRQVAPFDVTGYWVAVVTEDWRWRMVTPPKGDVSSIPLTDAGIKVAQSWDPATDGSCQAFGVAGLMRQPTRLNISWENDNILKIDTDNGVQTRRLMFSADAQPGPRSLQGFSRARWERGGGGGVAGRGGGGAPAAGHLVVQTSNTSGGWLRKNGVPYSQQMTMTEYMDVFTTPNGDIWLVHTQLTTDPMYLNGEWVTSNHFKKEPNGSKWAPAPCKG